MDIHRNGSRPTRRGPADYFTGTVWMDPIVNAPAPARVAAACVAFEPGARTAWHTHPLGQTLYVISGVGRVQKLGEPVCEIRAGDNVADGDEVEISDASVKLAFSFGFAKGEVNGTVLDDKGEPAPGAVIGLIPSPRRAFYLRAGRADQNGSFKVSNVPPGEYLVCALARLEAGALEDDEFLKPIRSKMTRIKVEDSAQNVSLKLLSPEN